jgi:flagellin
MGFRINTNIAALNSHKDGTMVNRGIGESLEKLSSGLRINKAADDSSGLMIADGLRNQANSLGQSIRNVNDAIGIVQIADKAMDEQVKILDTIKVKATQSAQDGQTSETRKALQSDIVRLLEELDNIAYTTSFNGQNLLAGAFNNKEFQIGAFSNESVKASIPATNANKIGETRFETGSNITASGEISLIFSSVNTSSDLALESVKISTSPNTGIGVLAETINKNSDALGGIKATWNLLSTGQNAIASGNVTGLAINGINIGDIYNIQANDKDGKLVNAINDVKSETGVEAYIDNRGNLNLRSLDGRGIKISGTNLDTTAGFGSTAFEEYGRLSLSRLGAKDINVYAGANGLAAGFSAGATVAENVLNIASLRGKLDADAASAIGAYENGNVESYGQELGAGITTLAGAMAVMSLAENAQKALDKTRADLGSIQNQLVSTVNNISVTQVSAKSSESFVRDVDFAKEVANFERGSLLAQSGSFAMSQSNQVSQNVMKLLQ